MLLLLQIGSAAAAGNAKWGETLVSSSAQTATNKSGRRSLFRPLAGKVLLLYLHEYRNDRKKESMILCFRIYEGRYIQYGAWSASHLS